MWIILDIEALIKFEKAQNWLLFKQIYWQELSKPLIKKPTCFQVSFSTSSSITTITQVYDFYIFKIYVSYNAHYVKWGYELTIYTRFSMQIVYDKEPNSHEIIYILEYNFRFTKFWMYSTFITYLLSFMTLWYVNVHLYCHVLHWSMGMFHE